VNKNGMKKSIAEKEVGNKAIKVYLLT